MATPTTISPVTHLMVESYDERPLRLPSIGFQSLFSASGRPPVFVFDSESFSYDIVRTGKKISKLVLTQSAARSIGSVQKANVGMKFQNASNVFPAIVESNSADWTQTLSRVAGEDPYGNLTRFERLRELLVQGGMEDLKRIVGRIEKMAAESIINGTVTLDDTAGSQYDFDRSSNNTFAAPLFWTNAAATPLVDLDNLARAISQNSGMAPDYLVFGRSIFNAFVNNAQILVYADNTLNYSFVAASGLAGTEGGLDSKFQFMLDAGFKHMGNVITAEGRGFPIFNYLEQYQTDAGVWTDYLEAKTVLMGTSGARLDRYFGPSITIPPSQMEQQAMMSKLGISPMEIATMPSRSEGVIDVRAFNWDFDTPQGAQTSVFLRTHIAPVYIPTAVDAFGTITAIVA